MTRFAPTTRRARARRVVAFVALVAAALVGAPVAEPTLHSQTAVGALSGVREPAWSPDGRRIAVSILDHLWTMAPDGKQPKAVTPQGGGAEREPAWSRDGQSIAFAADRGDRFDLYVVAARGGTPVRVTTLAGDERSPSWTPDGRLVFAHREPDANWHLFVVAPTAGGWGEPAMLTSGGDNDTEPRVSPDGARVLFVSDRDSEDSERDLWVMPLPKAGESPAAGTAAAPASSPDAAARSLAAAERRTRPRIVVRARGDEGQASWAPQGDRVAYYAVREGVGSTWVATVDPAPADERKPDEIARPRPLAPPTLVSRRGGATAWSPDGRTILVAALPDPLPGYNGNPDRDATEPPPLFGTRDAYRLWTLPAPLPIDAGIRAVGASVRPAAADLAAAFDRVWETLRRLYYGAGESAARWEALSAKYKPEALRAADDRAFEAVVDAMVLEQPLIRPAVSSTRAVVVSAHPLASEAGRLAIDKGGNVVDAMIATAFALGVVEPDATSIGGDGQAVLFLKGMSEPTVVEYKDMVPIHGTLDNPKIMGNGRIVADGPAAANIPGVVAGLDYLYAHYASGKVSWADLIAPAIRYADEGFVLDAALPTSIAEGRQYLQKWPEAAKLFMPGGRIPRPGDRFVNRDYAETLRTIAREGAGAFYTGTIAKQIVADMEANGGILGMDDLGQYRAVERKPIVGRYRGHVLFSGGPPVGSSVGLFESLQILDRYQPKAGARSATDADYWHYQIESWKVRDTARRVADPAFWPVDVETHLTPAHAAERFGLIDPMKASAAQEADDDPVRAAGPERIGRGTTAFVVADAEGNMIAVTQTLSTWGGTFYVSKGLGFLYNNHLRSSRTAAGYGRMLPLTRSNTTSVPTLVFREEPGARVPRLAVGCAGNAWIPASVFEIVGNVIDGGLSMQRAIEAPRFLVGRDPADPKGTASIVQIEDRFPRAVVDALVARGHTFQKIGRKGEVRYGYAAGALVDVEKHRVEGGAEPRRSHATAAVASTPGPTP